MSDLSDTELRRLDLTLLLVFLGLIRHRKALDVAAELGLTQSAISQALKRLRDIFRDELFLRRPHGLEPTATALALEAPVGRAVDALRGALGAARAFDPAQASGVLRISALDAEQSVVIPPLAARLRERSPGIALSVLPLGRGAAMEALTAGRADLALGFVWDVPEAISGEKLYEESFLVAGLPKALPKAPRISLEAYCASDHLLVSPGGDLRGVVDDKLEAIGRRRRIVLGLPAFLPALAAVGLVTARPPIEVRSFPISVFWHRRNDADPRIVWIRQQVKLTVSGLRREA
jgi:DNA-binding transcriptional LysR family regulator